MNRKIAIVGSGRVAEVLIKQFSSKIEPENICIIARNAEKCCYLAQKYNIKSYSFSDKICEQFDYVILAVKDGSIAEVSDFVAAFSRDAIVCHTSGCVNINVLSDKITNKGVFYPLQSITEVSDAGLLRIPLFIEAQNEASYDSLCGLARLISDNVSRAGSETREKLHLCAVFANNFTNHIFTLVNDLVESEGVSAECLKPLVETTFERVLSANPKDIQTGPARRGDLSTINRHLELIKDQNAKDVYTTMSNSILNLYKNEL